MQSTIRSETISHNEGLNTATGKKAKVVGTAKMELRGSDLIPLIQEQNKLLEKIVDNMNTMNKNQQTMLKAIQNL